MTAQSLPRWALPVVIAVALLAIGLAVWRGMAGGSGEAAAGKDLVVHPGMYDMRTEMKKPRPSPP